MITVLAPHCRPEYATNLLASFHRQLGAKRLVVVLNGRALRTAAEFWATTGAIVLESDPHQAAAMNVGLRWLRQHVGGAWSRFDDDDYYGPRYLERTTAELQDRGADVVGKPWSFVMLDEGLHRFSLERNDCWAHDFGLTGGTLAAASPEVEDFAWRLDDDLEWCRAMRRAGARLWSGTPYGYCYDRRYARPRVAQGGSVVTRRAFGECEFYGPQPFAAVDSPGLQPLERLLVPSSEELMRALW